MNPGRVGRVLIWWAWRETRAHHHPLGEPHASASRRLRPGHLRPLVLAGSASADDEYGRTGAYVGLAGAWAIENFQGENPLSFDHAVGLSARVGYRALPYLAGEVQWEHLPEFDSEIQPGNLDFNLRTHALTGNVKLVYPDGPMQLYALGGFGFLHADFDQGTSPELDMMTRFGGGMDIYFGDHVVGTLEATYVLPFDKVNDLDYISVIWGLAYRF